MRERGSSSLCGVKKNCMRLLRENAQELLRQGGSPDTGFILRRCQNLSGSGSQAGFMHKARKSEAGKAGLACGQSVLHEAVWILCGAKVPEHDRKRCGGGTEAGLAHSQVAGQRVHGRAASQESGCGAACNRNRRNIPEKRPRLSHRRTCPLMAGRH